MKNGIIILVFCLTFCNTFAQKDKPVKNSLSIDGADFKPLNEFYIFGDTRVIGNNILSEHKSKPINKSNLINDDVKMKYVDIDDNPETFSSSSAKLELPPDLKKIVYAGLYWTGTYSYEKGTRRKSNNNYIFKGDLRKKTNIEKVKLKTPNGDYIDIEGGVIYDGIVNQTHAINSPYACYADVTKILKETNNLNGDFTVANVKASQGYISGGSAAGWMLYVVYQSPTDNPKYITTFNGFSLVNNEPVDINFKNFKSLDQGDVKTSIVVATLEGDSNLLLDECSIIKKDGTFQSLSNGARNRYNFFNSSITNNSLRNRDRTPNSSNTLGFDIAKLDIPNHNNAVIDNNINETTLRLKTNSDRYYLFFTAFQTEISQTFFDDIIQEKESISTVATVVPEIIRAQPESILAVNKKKKTQPYRYTPKGLNSRAYKILKKRTSTIITDIEGGYYVVVGVFLEAQRAGKRSSNLIKKGYQADTFLNPKNNWNYVYVYYGISVKEAFKLQEKLKQNYRYRDTWILKANLD